MDAGCLTLRLALPATLWWSFVPLLEILSLFAASAAARRLPWRSTVDVFFQSHTPWFMWLIAFSAFWAFLPAETAYAWLWWHHLWYYSAAGVIAWGAWLDFRFFRQTLKRTRWQSARELFLQRMIAWTMGIAIFTGMASRQTVASLLGL